MIVSFLGFVDVVPTGAATDGIGLIRLVGPMMFRFVSAALELP